MYVIGEGVEGKRRGSSKEYLHHLPCAPYFAVRHHSLSQLANNNQPQNNTIIISSSSSSSIISSSIINTLPVNCPPLTFPSQSLSSASSQELLLSSTLDQMGDPQYNAIVVGGGLAGMYSFSSLFVSLSLLFLLTLLYSNFYCSMTLESLIKPIRTSLKEEE